MKTSKQQRPEQIAHAEWWAKEHAEYMARIEASQIAEPELNTVERPSLAGAAGIIRSRHNLRSQF